LYIRVATRADFAVLKRIWLAVFPGEESEAGIEAFFQKCFTPAGAFLLYADDGEPAATAYLVLGTRVRDLSIDSFDAEATIDCPYLYSVGVREKYRGLGYGKAVTRFAAQQAFALGYSCVATCPANDALVPFYAGLGFEREISLSLDYSVPDDFSGIVFFREKMLLMGS
jgi:GNAT superfamily N-acetyltransferase